MSKDNSTSFFRSPLFWVSTLYLSEGIPYNVIDGTAAKMYKSLGYSDGQITTSLGFIGLAWSLKPIWAAFLDMYRTKKFFVLLMEFLMAGVFVGVAMSVPGEKFFQISLALFWVAAFASSTQDICADGIYLTSLDKSAQAKFAGLQGIFWNLGKPLSSGLLIWFLDSVREQQGWSHTLMWQAVMVACAAMMALLGMYHYFMLPSGSVSKRPDNARAVIREFAATAVTFFHKRAFWGMIAFVFLYRIGEGLILMEGQLFLQSPVEQGGLGLSVGEVSKIDGIWGTGSSMLGGLLGGIFVARLGLWRSLGILGLCLNIPHFTYVYLSQAAADGHSVSYATIATMYSIEKFGYSFGFIGNMIYMMQQLAPGRSAMTHYAFATSLMQLMLIPTKMMSGPLAEWLGFSTFFVVVMFASIPSVWAAFKAPFPHKSLEDGEETAAGLDDPAMLSPVQRAVQALAGKASLFAMLNVLLIIADVKILGTLYSGKNSPGFVHFLIALLICSVALKVFFSVRTFMLAREAANVAQTENEKIYLSNARGAKIATWVCALVGAGVLAFGARMAF